MTLNLSGSTGISGVDGSAGTPALQGTDANTGISFPAADTVAINTGGSERTRVDSSGRLLVGTSSALPVYYNSVSTWNGLFQVARSTQDAVANLSIWDNSASTYTTYGGAQIHLSACKSGTVGAHTSGALASGDSIASINFNASDGTNFRNSARIEAVVDAGVSTGDVPGRLVFSTTADGASSPTERMRIRNNGRVFINTTDGASPTVANTSFADFGGASSNFGLWLQSHNDTTLYVNRQADDGAVIEIRQAGTLEGTISVSGTTVTYGGGHLARWSQLPNNEDPSTLLKGTVMSNLDEMCEWGEEDNEQLNKTKISDVEGDKNVAGVFVSTSFSDDGPLDFFVAMTGDMVIRIAEGVTVERGDLLMSAGDGTAKPQDDDIIRSKTIAKVTSTTVSCTYEDGSYCVPCVLMAC
jgi:hypothetical protein